MVNELSQTFHEEGVIEVTPILRDGKGHTPELVWFCDKSLKYRGFVGDGEFGACVAINFSGKMMTYAISTGNLKAPVLVLNYLLLHELSHWAEDSVKTDKDHSKRWMPFLMELLIAIEKGVE